MLEELRRNKKKKKKLLTYNASIASNVCFLSFATEEIVLLNVFIFLQKSIFYQLKLLLILFQWVNLSAEKSE